MQTEYKYREIIRDDTTQTTKVTFNIYNGDFADITYDDVDLDTKQPKQVTRTIFQRTTPLNQPLEQHTATFEGILTEDELKRNVNKIVKDLVKGKAYDNPMLATQQDLPLPEKAVINITKNR